MTWVAVAVGAGSAITGFLGSRNASRAQQRAARDAQAYQQQMYNQTRADQQPWMGAGQRAIGSLEAFMRGDGGRRFQLSDFQEDPGFQFRRDQGEQSINRNALARGRFNSGSALKELQTYNSGLASQEFGNAFDRWRAGNNDIFDRYNTISEAGRGSAGTVANAGMNAAGGISNAIQGEGNARSAGIVGGTNALINGMGQGMNWWQGQQALDRIAPRNRSTPFNLDDYNSWANRNT
jgi:uncharacterized protein YukE